MDCENLDKCIFFREYTKDSRKRLALRGFATMYCQGNKQNECIRKKVCNILGSPTAVPANMMPNGKPIFGTSNENWDDRVFSTLDQIGVTYFRKGKYFRRPLKEFNF